MRELMVATTGATDSEGLAADALFICIGGIPRTDGAADLGVPFHPLIRLAVPSYAADELPPELAAIPPVKPGSRA